ncbi:sulfur carrier protein ThiS [Christensenellaceae bacterium NSJ-44]|jgi:sulfur carrier protein|uniref:Sulfur carrier protein ThiS n=1 Tax=Luoshenia tenuis TaxID=2763654 RepID=A0A926HLJ7_9FIRM|nr:MULTISPECIES: sulfur carrier protein ThiS [Clostridia]MBC8528544.1 sulfur carrier protein ThiS [Luoshenia tenuis]
MTVNGKIVGQEERNLKQLLQTLGYDLARIAVERNGQIVPRAEYAETVLDMEDELEVVSFVGGG